MDQQLKQDAQIEAILKSQSLAPMPRSITLDVMTRIQTIDAKRPAIITWSDFALSSVIAACLASFWFASQHLPPILLAKIRIQGILLHQAFLVNSRWLVPALIFGFAAFLAALTIPVLVRMMSEQGNQRKTS